MIKVGDRVRVVRSLGLPQVEHECDICVRCEAGAVVRFGDIGVILFMESATYNFPLLVKFEGRYPVPMKYAEVQGMNLSLNAAKDLEEALF